MLLIYLIFHPFSCYYLFELRYSIPQCSESVRLFGTWRRTIEISLIMCIDYRNKYCVNDTLLQKTIEISSSIFASPPLFCPHMSKFFLMCQFYQIFEGLSKPSDQFKQLCSSRMRHLTSFRALMDNLITKCMILLA